MLQVGGVHEAMTVAPPGLAPETAPLATVTDAGREDVQVNGTPVMVVPLVSTTTAVKVFDPDPLKASELTGVLPLSRVICCTGQVVKVTGTLVVPPTDTNTGLVPGVFAVTWTCPGKSPAAVVLSPPTFAVNICQVGLLPTVEEISAPEPLFASS
jgi:hypothetical protein